MAAYDQWGYHAPFRHVRTGQSQQFLIKDSFLY